MGGTAISSESGHAIVKLNPHVYNLEMAYATAYVFLDRAWILFEGDPKSEIIVKLASKEKSIQAESIAKAFCNEIISITNYFNQMEKNRDIINTILQRALFSASPSAAREAEEAEIDKILKEADEIAPSKQIQ